MSFPAGPQKKQRTIAKSTDPPDMQTKVEKIETEAFGDLFCTDIPVGHIPGWPRQSRQSSIA